MIEKNETWRLSQRKSIPEAHTSRCIYPKLLWHIKNPYVCCSSYTHTGYEQFSESHVFYRCMTLSLIARNVSRTRDSMVLHSKFWSILTDDWFITSKRYRLFQRLKHCGTMHTHTSCDQSANTKGRRFVIIWSINILQRQWLIRIDVLQ